MNEHPFHTSWLEQLNELLQEALGSQTEIVAHQIFKQQLEYIVAVIELRHPTAKVVVKLAGPNAQLLCPFEQTARLHRLVQANTAVPVAEILHIDVSYQRWPWRVIIQSFVDGARWADVLPNLSIEQKSTVYAQLGDCVAQLHGVQFAAFDPFIVSAETTTPPTFANTLRQRAHTFIQTDSLRNLFLTVLDDRRALFEPITQPQLCHEDLHGFNILLQQQGNDWKLAAILDFDKAWAGCGESDLARLSLWTEMTSPEFWRAYEQHTAIDPLFEQRRPIFQLFWCLSYARSTPKHLRDTRAVCELLGIQPITSF